MRWHRARRRLVQPLATKSLNCNCNTGLRISIMMKSVTAMRYITLPIMCFVNSSPAIPRSKSQHHTRAQNTRRGRKKKNPHTSAPTTGPAILSTGQGITKPSPPKSLQVLFFFLCGGGHITEFPLLLQRPESSWCCMASMTLQERIYCTIDRIHFAGASDKVGMTIQSGAFAGKGSNISPNLNGSLFFWPWLLAIVAVAANGGCYR